MAETKIQLQDTGYRQVGDTGEAPEIQANSGSSFDLNVTVINYKIPANVSDESYRKYVNDDQDNEFDFPEVSTGSVGVPYWSVNGILDLSVSEDQNTMGYLVKAAKTKGYKKLSTTDNTANTIMIRFSEDGGGVTYKNVRIADLSFKQNPESSKVKWTLSLAETT